MRKSDLYQAVTAAGKHIEIAFVCSPAMEKGAAVEGAAGSEKNAHKSHITSAANALGNTSKSSKKAVNGQQNSPEVPDFKAIDDAVAKILAQIAAKLR